VLETLKGRFIMTLNDVPPIRKAFAGFKMEPVTLTYSLAGNNKAKPARELIIRG
jgi:DNA adenine methylase